LGQAVTTQLGQLGTLQSERLEGFARELGRFSLGLDERFERLKMTVEGRLTAMQADNAAKLEEMRQTVDEKLHATLEQRLGESFKQVSERLEQVHRGLGEMQTLATGVGDLKRVLGNVKTRGTWGEMQLSALLEQLLTADQFSANVATRPGSNERVDFAIRLPGKGDGAVVWLPIDAKFPIEDYQRLLDAQERGEPAQVEEAARAIELRLKSEAKSIRDKYVAPPHTTDFALLYLPIEGLYAEALRRPGLAELMQREWRVSLAGPTTLAAMLNSLQMGFRTLAIEQRSAEVWALLGAVKTEFGKFGEALAHTRKKLDEASNSIGKAETRTRQLSRRLKEVEAMPVAESELLIGTADLDADEE
jgi:DNA recombination protein RmuC